MARCRWKARGLWRRWLSARQKHVQYPTPSPFARAGSFVHPHTPTQPLYCPSNRRTDQKETRTALCVAATKRLAGFSWAILLPTRCVRNLVHHTKRQVLWRTNTRTTIKPPGIGDTSAITRPHVHHRAILSCTHTKNIHAILGRQCGGDGPRPHTEPQRGARAKC